MKRATDAEIIRALADAFELTPLERVQLIASAKATKKRVGSARTLAEVTLSVLLTGFEYQGYPEWCTT